MRLVTRRRMLLAANARLWPYPAPMPTTTVAVVPRAPAVPVTQMHGANRCRADVPPTAAASGLSQWQ